MGLFVAEGVRLVEEALEASLVEQLFLPSGCSVPAGGKICAEGPSPGCPGLGVHGRCALRTDRHGAFPGRCRRGPQAQLAASVLRHGGDCRRDPGSRQHGCPAAYRGGSGAQGLLVVKGSVDVYSPKVLRASMGAVFHLPHWMMERREVLEFLGSRETALVVADLEDAEDFGP